MRDDSEQRISFRQLADAAAAVAAGLQRVGVVPRQRVAIMLPTSPDHFSAYVGILMAGAISPTIYPPTRPLQLEDHVLRRTGILDNAQAIALVTVPEAEGGGTPALVQAVEASARCVRQLPAAVPRHGPDLHLARVAPIDAARREPFTRELRAVPAAPDDAGALRFVACGRPLPGQAIRIVDDCGQEVSEHIEGWLEFKGPSATSGYFRNLEQAARLFHDGCLDSGDRAYSADGGVYITGRVKGIVIRGGRNPYPQEIEEAVVQVDGVRKGCLAVFGSPDPDTGTERVVFLAEARSAGANAKENAKAMLRDEVSRAVIDALGEPPDEIVLAPPHTVLKTSSGEVRRSACRALYEAGGVGASSPTARWQVLRLALGALVQHPPSGPCVLVSNHASYLDGVVLVAALPRPYAFVRPATARRLRAWPRRCRLGLMAALTLAALSAVLALPPHSQP